MIPRNKLVHRSSTRVLVASALTLAFWLTLVLGLGATAAGFVHESAYLYPGLSVVGGSVLLWIARTIASAPLRCTVCANPVFGVKDCSKHRSVKPFLGLSYGIPIATSSLCLGRFRCMYCGEPNPLRFVKGVEEKPESGSQVEPPSDRSMSAVPMSHTLGYGQSGPIPSAIDQTGSLPAVVSNSRQGAFPPNPQPQADPTIPVPRSSVGLNFRKVA